VSSQKLLVVDDSEELVQQVVRAVSAISPSPEVVWCDDLASFENLARQSGSFDVVVAGTMVSSDVGRLRQLRRLREGAPRTELIVAVDRWQPSRVRDMVRTGARDVVRLPVDDDVLLDALEQALRSAAEPSRTVNESRPPAGKGTVTTIISAAGGCGKTFLAANLGYYLQTKARRRTCLIDLDLRFGELAPALRLRPKYTIADLLAGDADNDDLSLRLEECLVHHTSGLRVLAAPAQPAEADGIDADAVARVIEAARTCFDHVIVDASTGLSETMLSALDQSDQIYALTTLDLPSVRNLGLLLSTLDKRNVPAPISLVLNKVEPDVGLDVDGVTKYLGQAFSIVVPYGREVNRSLNMGQPILASAPRCEVSKALSSGLCRSLDGSAQASMPTRRRWLGRAEKVPA
jgi:pilus assembly protein CpaE